MIIVDKNIEYQKKIEKIINQNREYYQKEFSKIDEFLNQNRLRIGNKIIYKELIGTKKEQKEFINEKYPYIKDKLDERVIRNNTIRNTKEYKDIMFLYNSLIDYLTDLLVKNNLDKNKPCYLELLLGEIINKNFLSETPNKNLDQYLKKDVDSITELLGTRIMTGEFYCRHITELIYNVLQRLNIDSSPYTIVNREKDIKHMIIARNDNNKIVYIDPVNFAIGINKNGNLTLSSLKNNEQETYQKNYFLYLLNYDDEIETFKNYFFLKNKNKIKIDNYKDIYKEALHDLRNNLYNLHKFKRNNLNKIKKISNYNKIITYKTN